MHVKHILISFTAAFVPKIEGPDIFISQCLHGSQIYFVVLPKKTSYLLSNALVLYRYLNDLDTIVSKILLFQKLQRNIPGSVYEFIYHLSCCELVYPRMLIHTFDLSIM